jgi:hypothetical protein
MSNAPTDSNEEITAGNRPVPVSNDEWNQQTIVDARSVLQIQQSVEPSQVYNEQRSSKINIFFPINILDVFNLS